jgi:hypothetical protein
MIVGKVEDRTARQKLPALSELPAIVSRSSKMDRGRMRAPENGAFFNL